MLGLVGWQLAWLPIDMYDAGGGLARAQFIAGAGLGWRGTKVRCSSVGTGQWLIGSQSQRSGWCGSSDDGARGTESGRIPARASWRAVWTVGMGRPRGPVAHAAPAPHAPWERGGMGLWRTAIACSPLTAGFCRTTADEQQLVSITAPPLIPITYQSITSHFPSFDWPIGGSEL